MYSSCKDPIFKQSNICLVCTTKQGISFHFLWSNFPSKHVTKWFYYIIHFLFYKQHFYKQPQVEIDKKPSKCYAAPWGWIFPVWILFTFFINVIIQRMIGHILKNKQKNKCLCSWHYTFNHNENEDENKSHNNRCDINRNILDKDTNTNIVNIKCLSC